MSIPTPPTGRVGPPDTNRRREDRRAICARCEVWIFEADGEKARVTDVVTRNVSFRGLSIVARLTRPLRTGQPIETIIAAHGRPPTHEAGMVAYCRSMSGGYYEIGIRVMAAAPNRILVGDARDIRERYDWFDEALRAMNPK